MNNLDICLKTNFKVLWQIKNCTNFSDRCYFFDNTVLRTFNIFRKTYEEKMNL